MQVALRSNVKEKVMNKCIRHGEVMLVPVNNTPEGEFKEYDVFIVGHSETGHHHVLESKAKFEVMSDAEKKDLYLRLFEPARLVHKKQLDAHKTLTIQPGVYRVVHKQEYDPWNQIITRVFD